VNKNREKNKINAKRILSFGVSLDIKPITMEINADENSNKNRWLFIFYSFLFAAISIASIATRMFSNPAAIRK
jgi:hypothetical protein